MFIDRRSVVAALLVSLLPTLSTAPLRAYEGTACIVDGILFDDCADSGIVIGDGGPGGIGGNPDTSPPDLTSLGGHIFLPTSIDAGQPYHAEVAIANFGGLGYSPTIIRVAFYLSPVGDDQLSPENRLGDVDIVFPVIESSFPDPTYVVVPVDGFLPATIAGGQYRLAVDIDTENDLDETKEFNNAVAGGPSIAVDGDPDLAPVAQSLDPTGVVPSGGSVTLSARLENDGDARIVGPASFEVRYRAIPPGGDELGGTVLGTQTVNLPSGSSLNAGGQLAIPPINVTVALPPGSYEVGLDVDTGSAVAEKDELNNSALVGLFQVGAPAGPPDLTPVPKSVTLGDDPVTPGTKMVIKVDLKNLGSSASPSTFEVRFVLSSDSTITASDFALEVQKGATISEDPNVDGLAAGANRVVTFQGFWPADLAAGTYSLGVIVDPSFAVTESNEKNNVAELKKIKSTKPCHGYATEAEAVKVFDDYFTSTGYIFETFAPAGEYCGAGNGLVEDAAFFGADSPTPPVDSCHFADEFEQFLNYSKSTLRADMHRLCVRTLPEIEALGEDSAHVAYLLELEAKGLKDALAAAKKKCDALRPPKKKKRLYCSCGNADYLNWVGTGPHPTDADCVYAP